MRVKITRNKGVGLEDITHLIGKEFDATSAGYENDPSVVTITHDGNKLDIAPEEYKIV